MSLLLSILGKKGGSIPSEPKPTITVVEAKPSSLEFTIVGALDRGGYEHQVSTSPTFDTPNSYTGASATHDFANIGAGTWYFRGRSYDTGTDEGGTWSNASQAVLSATPLRSLTMSADAGNGEVTLTHNCENIEPNVSTVDVYRRTTGDYSLIDSFAPTTAAYVDDTAVNGTTYTYYLRLIPDSLDYSATNSNTDSATPDTPTTQLSTPTLLTLTYDYVTEGNVTFSFAAVLGAVSYDIYLDSVFVANIGTTSRAFTGLTGGQTYTYSVIAKAGVGNTDSAEAFKTGTMPNLDQPTIRLENHGGEAYYIPLDGRRIHPTVDEVEDYIFEYEGDEEAALSARNAAITAAEGLNQYVDFPTITYTPYTQMSAGDKSALTGAGLNGSAYTKITASEAIIPTSVVGKQFCGLFNHLNPIATDGQYTDSYIPAAVGPRYASVVLRTDASNFYVDFEFNGGNRTTPQTQVGGMGYIFKDNSTALRDAMLAWKTNTDGIRTITLQPRTITNHVIAAYVCPDIYNITVDVAREFKMHTGTAERALLKLWREGYYYPERDLGVERYSQPNAWITFTGTYSQEFIFHNIQLSSSHYSWVTNPDNYQRSLFSGTRGGGITAVINGNNITEYYQLEQGQGVGGCKFAMSQGRIVNSGTYTGTGSNVLDDVTGFSYIYMRGCHFAGAMARGQAGGSTRGAQMKVDDATTYDFEDQNKWFANIQEFEGRFTTDYTGFPSHVTTRNYYPNHVFEITTDEGNFWQTMQLGGSRRHVCLAIKDEDLDRVFVFHSSAQGLRADNPGEFYSYWDACYRGATARNTWQRTGIVGVMNCYPAHTGKKLMILGNIIEVGNVYSVSKDYYVNQSFSTLINDGGANQVATIAVTHHNCIRDTICWTTMLGKYAQNFTSDDLAYMEDKQPIQMQAGDKFTVPSILFMDATTGWEAGDTILGATSGATGTIYKVHPTHVSYVSISGDFQDIEDITNGTTTHTSTGKSSHNPATEYTSFKVQWANAVPQGLPYDGLAGEPAEFVEAQNYYYVGSTQMSTNHQGYRFYRHVLDASLPTDLPTVFDIKVTLSRAEKLLDGTSRTSAHIYKESETWGLQDYTTGDVGWNYPTQMRADTTWTGGNAQRSSGSAGHLVYDTQEVSGFARYSDMRNGSYRMNKAALPTSYIDHTVNGQTVKALGAYTCGWVIINCRNWFAGQWYTPQYGSAFTQYDSIKTIYDANPLFTPTYASTNFPYPPRVRNFGTLGTTIKPGGLPAHAFEYDANIENAPPLPLPLVELLTNLGETP